HGGTEHTVERARLQPCRMPAQEVAFRPGGTFPQRLKPPSLTPRGTPEGVPFQKAAPTQKTQASTQSGFILKQEIPCSPCLRGDPVLATKKSAAHASCALNPKS